MAKIFCGIDWSEQHHQVALVDVEGRVLVNRRISDNVTGFAELVGLLAEHDAQAPVPVALETDRGLLAAGLVAAGRQVFSINPKAVDRDRYAVSGAKSDPGDAQVLACCAPTQPTTARSPTTPCRFGRSGCLPVHTRTRCGCGAATWDGSARCCGSSSLLRLKRSNLATNAAAAVLSAAPTPTAAAALDDSDVAELLATTGRGVRAKSPGCTGSSLRRSCTSQCGWSAQWVWSFRRWYARFGRPAPPSAIWRRSSLRSWPIIPTPRSCAASLGWVWSLVAGSSGSSATPLRGSPTPADDAVTPAPHP